MAVVTERSPWQVGIELVRVARPAHAKTHVRTGGGQSSVVDDEVNDIVVRIKQCQGQSVGRVPKEGLDTRDMEDMAGLRGEVVTGDVITSLSNDSVRAAPVGAELALAKAMGGLSVVPENKVARDVLGGAGRVVAGCALSDNLILSKL